MAKRRSDILESIGEISFTYGLGGIIALLLGGLLYAYRGAGYLVGLALVLIFGGVGLVGYAVYKALGARKVQGLSVDCVYCNAKNEFVEFPTDDFRCTSCNRLVPVLHGKILPVQQVRCGYCNTLNYYSEKNEVLICEECDHEIPLAAEDGKPARHVMRAYAVQDDDRFYELVLTGTGHKNEELIAALQHILALNRNQVKQMLSELPVTILTGITRKKAEMLQAQLALHEGATEMRPLQQ